MSSEITIEESRAYLTCILNSFGGLHFHVMTFEIESKIGLKRTKEIESLRNNLWISCFFLRESTLHLYNGINENDH